MTKETIFKLLLPIIPFVCGIVIPRMANRITQLREDKIRLRQEGMAYKLFLSVYLTICDVYFSNYKCNDNDIKMLRDNSEQLDILFVNLYGYSSGRFQDLTEKLQEDSYMVNENNCEELYKIAREVYETIESGN